MLRRFCDKCGEPCGPDGAIAKVRRGLGRFQGGELDLCGGCSVEILTAITGRADEDKGGSAPARRPRPPKPGPGLAAPAA